MAICGDKSVNCILGKKVLFQSILKQLITTAKNRDNGFAVQFTKRT